MSTLHARVLAVKEVVLGSELTADTAAGATTLTVADAADFDDDGGHLVINDQVIEYATFDDDTGTITLIDSLTEAAEAGDRVDVWDTLFETASTEKVAQVDIDRDNTSTDSLECTVAHHLVGELALGPRLPGKGESVRIERDGIEWRVVDILGLAEIAAAAGATMFYDQDVHVVDTTGDQIATLTYEPLPGSLHMRWNELPQEPTEYSVSGNTVVVPDADGVLASGDRLWFMYAYSPGQAAIDNQPAVPDSPWWEGNPAQGSTEGYPTGATATVYTTPPSFFNSNVVIALDLTAVFLDPSTGWDVQVFYHLAKQPDVDTNPSAPNAWVRMSDPVAPDASGFQVGGGGTFDSTHTRLEVKVAAVNFSVNTTDEGLTAYRKQVCEAVDVVGVMFTQAGDYPGDMELPAVAVNKPGRLGVTNGSKNRFYIGRAIAGSPDPLDVGGVADPYLPLNVAHACT